MTQREMIYDIKEVLNAYTDDTNLSDEHLAFMINTKRAMLMKQLANNLKKEVPKEAKQLICLTLEEDDFCEDDFMFLKSVDPIPETIDIHNRSNLSEIYLDSRVAKWLNVIDYGRLPYIKGGRFNDKQIYVTIDPNDYVIVYSKSGNHEYLEDIKLNIVAQNPEQADALACINEGEKCDFMDKDYPMELAMFDTIKKDILNELMVKFRIPTDTINNATEDSPMNNRPMPNGREQQ